MKKLYILALPLSAIIFCGENTPSYVCDPESGKFIKGSHFVSSRFLTEDNTWNYKELTNYATNKAQFLPEESCLPIKSGTTLEHTIKEESFRIDLNR